MPAILECPHCARAVVPLDNGLCPSCGKNVYDASEIQKTVDEKEWEEHIYWGLRQGVGLVELIKELVEKGYNETLVNIYALSRMEVVKAKRHAIIMARIFPAITIIVVGAVSLLTYLLAILGTTAIGVFAWGLLGVGLLMLVNGLFDLRRIR